ncbi:hypothetical protein RRG08_047220 [Elysia crispata]|uniref:Uncharacterized protein n=1 Tax=Elysia crispata TaxID=231223 RepID=A0AAE1EBI4_9GAST|nr:hypothetical protein RRG08_047220 [Elysia crispata]
MPAIDAPTTSIIHAVLLDHWASWVSGNPQNGLSYGQADGACSPGLADAAQRAADEKTGRQLFEPWQESISYALVSLPAAQGDAITFKHVLIVAAFYDTLFNVGFGISGRVDMWLRLALGSVDVWMCGCG